MVSLLKCHKVHYVMGKNFHQVFQYVVQEDFISMEVKGANYVMEGFLISTLSKYAVVMMKFLTSKLKNVAFVMEILINKEFYVALITNL